MRGSKCALLQDFFEVPSSSELLHLPVIPSQSTLQ